MPILRKLTFQEAWESATIFYVDEELKDEIDSEVAVLLGLSATSFFANHIDMTLEGLMDFLKEQPERLEVILKDIGLSEEKFLRIVSLLRKVGRVPGGFDREWNLAGVKQRLTSDQGFLETIATLLWDGKRDDELS